MNKGFVKKKSEKTKLVYIVVLPIYLSTIAGTKVPKTSYQMIFQRLAVSLFKSKNVPTKYDILITLNPQSSMVPINKPV